MVMVTLCCAALAVLFFVAAQYTAAKMLDDD